MVYPSNTAVPQYYAEFRDKVIRGEIPVCYEISQEMNRIDDRIRDKTIFYDPRPVEAFIDFCEGELTLTDGSKFKMLDSFKLWAEQLYGWYYISTEVVYSPDGKGSGAFVDKPVMKRLISKLYLIVARGSAKSMFLSFVQAYGLVVDPATTHQVTTAPTMKQAEEVMAPIRTALIRSPGPVLTFLTSVFKGMRNVKSNKGVLLTSTKKGIENFISGSLLEVRPMTIDKLQGLRPKIATVDEWLSGDVKDDVIGAIEQGASKLQDYIIVAVSSEGTVRNGVGDDIKLELKKILNGEYDDKHTSIFHYKLDDVSEVADPRMWIKAQPNLGITVSYETYRRDVERAEHAPSTRNDILAKRFGLPMEGYTYFFTYEETIPHPKKTYTKMSCAMGADLSQGDDFCSFTFLFPLRSPGFGVKSINFISKRTLLGLPPSIRNKYEEFLSERSLFVMEGAVLDMTEVYQVLDEEIQRREYDVLTMGYDPYNSDAFVKQWVIDYGEYGTEVVRQGSRTESVPLGEIKATSEDRLLFFDEKIFMYAMGNTMVLEDTNGNRKLFKRRYDNKIDPVAALMDAWVAYHRNIELFK